MLETKGLVMPNNAFLDEIETCATVVPIVQEPCWLAEEPPPVRLFKFPHEFPDIPEASPIRRLRELKRNWDGEGAEPFSLLLLHRAQKFWIALESIGTRAQVSPGREDFISFVWTEMIPEKRLDIWIYGGSNFRAEWEIELTHAIENGTASGLHELLGIVRRYLNP